MMRGLLLFVSVLVVAAWQAATADTQCARERAAMVETIRAYTRLPAAIVGAQNISQRVLAAIAQTPRHLFIPASSCAAAYADGPVRIGHGQTISQPFIVALMTELAAVEPHHTVLEIGTGSGYQAAVLSRLANKVCTVEIIPALAKSAGKLLKELGHDNVSVHIGDGYHGWPQCGPFDAVVVTAALGHVPPSLIAQLKAGGRIVMPVGPAGAVQELTVIEKTAAGEIKTRSVLPVRFVPFTRSRD
jgi:protein-L-isoaspartate(D-aspartate) O-methyltransferase